MGEAWQGPDAPEPPEIRRAAPAPADVPPDGRGVVLEEVVLDDVDWSGARLPGLRLLDAELRRGNLANLAAPEGSMRRVTVSNARLTGLQWTEGRIADVTFRGCRMDLVSFVECGLERVAFEGCLLGQSDFQGARMRSVRFEGCDLSEADVTGARLRRCELRGCTLTALRGLDALRGAAMPWADVVGMAGALAGVLGIHVLDTEDAR